MAGYYDEITGEYVTESDDSYTGGGAGFGELDNTSGTEWDFWGSIGIDPNSISPSGTPPTNDEIWEQIQGGGSWLSRLPQTALNALKGTFTKKVNGKDVTDWRAVAGAAGGLYGLYQSQQRPQQAGYQGGIPKYEAVREAVPGSHYDPDRRAGSGGQRYFSNMKYTAPGEATTTARTAAREEAAGFETRNRENPANQPRRPTATAVERGQESEQVREGSAASDVIKRLPVPKLAHGGIAALAKGGAPRYLSGATDGMADKIPARIDGSQEARLSHGEFVIPADVVGHLGNGNSEAGAQRLYAMMDKIRQARTGTTKQGKQINPNKFLPT
jgi:hypothetical protein